MPYSGINLSYSTSAPVGPGDADIMIALRAEHHRPTADYVRMLRARLHDEFPSTTFSFLPSDIVSQILNFGLPAPLDVQVVGFNLAANREFANALLAKLQQDSGRGGSAHPAGLRLSAGATSRSTASTPRSSASPSSMWRPTC